MPAKPTGAQGQPQRRTSLQQTSSVTEKWEGDIVQRVGGILKASKTNLAEVFGALDPAGSGQLTLVEFRNAVRKLGLGLSSREIDQLVQRANTNGT